MALNESKWPTVSLVTVNLDGRAHLEVLLESLKSQTYPSDRVEVWVVDNGSTDGTVAWLREHHSHVQIIENPSNLGFARPNNQAATQATGKYLALVNNDMRLEPDWLERLVRFLEDGPGDVACAGSLILNWDGSRLDFHRGTAALTGQGFQPGYDTPMEMLRDKSHPDEILFACGGAMMIRRDFFLEVGGFDEDYFAYYEDVDLGWRLWVLGYRVRLCPEAICHHRHNGTSSRFARAGKTVLFERNALLTACKNLEDVTLDDLFPAALLLTFKRLAVRSGIDREGFRFGPRPAEPVKDSVEPPLWRRGLRTLRRRGIRGSTQVALVALARQILRRFQMPDAVAEGHVAVSRESWASVVAMEDVIDLLPRLQDKRRTIQANRKRTDSQIFARLGDALTPVEGQAEYIVAHAQVMRELGLDARVLGAQPPMPIGQEGQV